MALYHVTEETYEAEVENSPVPVLIDFFASWCGPCRMLSPIIEEIAAECGDRFRVVKVDVDEAPGLASRFGITSIPTLVVIKDKKPVRQALGYMPKEQVLALLEDETK